MTQEIRRLAAADYPDLIRVWADAGLPYRPLGRDRIDNIADQMLRPDTAFFGLFDDGRLVAAVLASFDGRKGWINRLAVDPDHRHRGYAGRLIVVCEEFLLEHGAQVIAVLIEEDNLPSIALFQKFGYLYGEGILYLSKRESEDS